METAACCGMELTRSAVWNQPKGLNGINAKALYIPGYSPSAKIRVLCA